MFLCIWQSVLCTTFYCTHFQAIFLFKYIFINKLFHTILKLTGAYKMNRDNKSATSSDKLEDLCSSVDTLESDSNLNTLPFPRKSTE